jgi:hypothetical protein
MTKDPEWGQYGCPAGYFKGEKLFDCCFPCGQHCKKCHAVDGNATDSSNTVCDACYNGYEIDAASPQSCKAKSVLV